jgi:1-acyl-sn-glycerol-3-phosphate acyltransferase
MSRSFITRASQNFIKFLARLSTTAAFQIRCNGRNYLPPEGGALLLSNHQSNLDPFIIGLASDRLIDYVARRTLFRFKPFGWFITWLGAIPIEREGTGFGGLKETLKRIKHGAIVLLFPEGTRTPDGEVHPMKPGFCAIARRAGVPIIPVALDGTFDAWPRYQRLPRRAVIHVQFGEPIEPSAIQAMTDEQLVQEVERRIRACHARCRKGRIRAMALSI